MASGVGGRMGDEELAVVGPAAASLLALVLSLLNLYLQRRDRRPRLKVRVRYEYRAVVGEDPSVARMHDRSQRGLYMRLGDFLREHGLEYPRGTPVVRFAISNEGEKVAYLSTVRLVFREGGVFGRRMVLDPVQDRVMPVELARGVANVVGGQIPVEIVPGDGVGYRFSLTRLATALEREGHAGDVQLVLEAADRLGNTYRRPFRVSTDLWAYHEEGDSP